MASNLYSELSSVGQCHGQGSPLLAGPLSHSPECHYGLAPSRSGHECLCRSMPRGDPQSGKWEGCQYLRPQLPANKTLSQSMLWHRAVQDQCADNSSLSRWWLLSISAGVTASSTLRPMGCAGGRVILPFPFGLGRYRSLVAGSNLCSAWCAGLSD